MKSIMNKKHLIFMSMFFCASIHSTLVEDISLEQLIEQTDHVVIGLVIAVDAVDKKGKVLTDSDAHTGPGLTNTIRLHVRVLDDGIICSNSLKPKTLIVPLWQQWHYSVGDIRRATLYSQSVFLLTGADTKPAYYRDFQIGLGSIESILSEVRKVNAKRKGKPKISCIEGRDWHYFAEKEYKAALAAKDKEDFLRAHYHLQTCLQYDAYHTDCSRMEKEFLKKIYSIP